MWYLPSRPGAPAIAQATGNALGDPPIANTQFWPVISFSVGKKPSAMSSSPNSAAIASSFLLYKFKLTEKVLATPRTYTRWWRQVTQSKPGPQSCGSTPGMDRENARKFLQGYELVSWSARSWVSSFNCTFSGLGLQRKPCLVSPSLHWQGGCSVGWVYAPSFQNWTIPSWVPVSKSSNSVCSRISQLPSAWVYKSKLEY